MPHVLESITLPTPQLMASSASLKAMRQAKVRSLHTPLRQKAGELPFGADAIVKHQKLEQNLEYI